MLILFVVVGLVIWTISTASKQNLDEDNTYLKSYQFIDENINEILVLQKEFDSRYSAEILTESFDMGSNSIKVAITDNSGEVVGDAAPMLYLTRPHTAQDDMELGVMEQQNGYYQSPSFELQKPGRYQAVLRVEIDDTIGFFKKEINATKEGVFEG